MKKNRVTYIVLFLILVLLATGCMFLADQVQQGFWGNVKISNGVVDSEYGMLTYKLYTPATATKENQAPGALLLHGNVQEIASEIKTLRNAHRALHALRGKKLGCIGKPSDWLIASDYDAEMVEKKLGVGFVEIPMEELLAEIAKNSYEDNEYTELFKKSATRARSRKRFISTAPSSALWTAMNLRGCRCAASIFWTASTRLAASGCPS